MFAQRFESVLDVAALQNLITASPLTLRNASEARVADLHARHVHLKPYGESFSCRSVADCSNPMYEQNTSSPFSMFFNEWNWIENDLRENPNAAFGQQLLR